MDKDNNELEYTADQTISSMGASQRTEPINESDNNPINAWLLLSINMKLLKVAIPAVSSSLVIIMVEAISMMYVGHLNDTHAVAGVGLAVVYVNGTTTSVLMGLNGAVGVLVSIAYGQGDLTDCERILQRGKILCFLASIPLFFVQISCYPILIYLGVEEPVAMYTAQYGFFLFLAMTFHCQFDCYRNFLNSVGQSKILQYAVSSTIFIHIVLCYLLTMYWDFGVMGVSFSTMVTIFFNMLFVMIYAWKVSEYEIRPVPRRMKPLLRQHDLRTYMSIGVPSIIMLMAEWIGVEIMIVLAATISVSALGAMSISYSFFNIIYQFPYGF